VGNLGLTQRPYRLKILFKLRQMRVGCRGTEGICAQRHLTLLSLSRGHAAKRSQRAVLRRGSRKCLETSFF